MIRLSKTLGKEWILPSFYHHTSKKLAQTSPECRQFLNAIWPSAISYDSPLCPIFLAEVSKIQVLAKRPIWLIRDGLVPLSWFFEMHPKPPVGLKTRLFIAEKLSGYVPTAWRKLFGTYRLVSRTPSKRIRGAKKLFLASVVLESYCSRESLRQKCQEVRRLLGPKIASEPHLGFFPIHQELPSAFPSQFIIDICQTIPGTIQAIDWPKFNQSDSLQGYSLFEFNDDLICADSYLSHAVLTRGATLLNSEFHLDSINKIEKGCSYTELSPYHGMIVRPQISKDSHLEIALQQRNEMSSYYQGYNRAMRSKANLKYPWPTWLMEWGARQKNLINKGRVQR